MIPPNDRGFTLGDGVFETVLADEGRLVAFDRHMARMIVACGALDLPPPPLQAAREAAASALSSAGLIEARAAVRLTWTAGSGGRGLDRPDATEPRLIVTAAPAPEVIAPATLMIASVRRNETSLTSRHKTLSYLDNVLARAEARAAGADEALMLNSRGELACAAAANVFWLRDDVLFTPALTCGALAGIVRADVLASARAMGLTTEEVTAPPSVLHDAEAVFITNSLIGVRLSNARNATATEQVSALAAAVSSASR